uniref:Pro-adrenomedullin n=1 Tax=Leptobrachium leishanense TaxID=445787 RepID=A0A8C5QPF1_9ANUR
MDLAPIILLHLSYLALLGSAASRTDVHRTDRTLWGLIGQNRIRRDTPAEPENSARVGNAAPQSAFIKTDDTKEPLLPPTSDAAHIRVKRYRHSMNHFSNLQSMRVGCRFGTCTIQNLAHQIYQYTDKDKDSTAPAKKISSQGYGRRRRSLPDSQMLLTLVDGKIRPYWVSTKDKAQEQIQDLALNSQPDQDRARWRKSKVWEALLRAPPR